MPSFRKTRMRSHGLRHSIGTKIFGAFLAMSILIAGLGAYGYYVLAASGQIVADTYDHPMMAINFARAASVDFLEMQNAALRVEKATPAQAAKLARQIDDLASTLSDDLDVAQERATAADERKIIGEIRNLVAKWQSERHAARLRNKNPDLSALDSKILDRFDLLIEFNADHGFISRREAVTHVGRFEEAVIGVTAMALLLAGGITIFLARRIVRPLSAAALVAERIAKGEFETTIPRGGEDETGALLRSMRVMQDSIAEQMDREKARAQSAEGRLMDAVESSDEGFILTNGEGNIAVANSELTRLFPDLAESFAPGKPLTEALARIDALCPSSDASEPSLSDALSNLAAGAPAGAERLLPDGRWVRIAASRASEGGSILFFSDFTDFKAREEGYRIAKQQAEAANAAKSRFLANMSHELRTPLNAVIGFSEILSGELFGPLGDRRYAEYSGDILRSGRSLLTVINNVLDLAKSDSGKIHLRSSPTDLFRILDDSATALRGNFAISGLTFVGPAQTDPIIVDADEAKLRQVFLNLMSNAIKFTEKGGTIRVAVREESDTVTIEVSDTGIGMSPEGIRTALTPFAQVDSRLERRYEGAGLGLPLAKAFVELHEGTLAIQSEPGRGTTVSVRLPRTAFGDNSHPARAAAG
jgi:signal transduction histidine kinase/HAMP domain-containing protein